MRSVQYIIVDNRGDIWTSEDRCSWLDPRGTEVSLFFLARRFGVRSCVEVSE